MQHPAIWVRAGCLCGAGAIVAVFENVHSGAALNASNPWSYAVIAAATAVAAALGRAIHALILEYGRNRR